METKKSKGIAEVIVVLMVLISFGLIVADLLTNIQAS